MRTKVQLIAQMMRMRILKIRESKLQKFIDDIISSDTATPAEQPSRE